MANMACTISYQEHGSIKRVVFAWLSDDAAGTVAGATKAVNGMLLGVQFIPSAVTAPTNGYDVTLTDQYGLDVLMGEGANLSNVTATFVVPVLQNAVAGTGTALVPLDGILTLAIANAGNAKLGTIVLYTG